MDAQDQRRVCKKYKSPYLEVLSNLKVGISKETMDGRRPVHGLRHLPVGDTSGWYIWSGEKLDNSEDFFLPLHIKHLEEICPLVLPYLGLAPGFRFILNDDYEDVWFDEQIAHE